MDVTAILDRFYSAYNAHDALTAAALYQSDGEHADIAQGRPRRGRQDIAEGLTYFLASFPDSHWEVRLQIIDESRAAVSYTLTGSLQRDIGPFVARGQELVLRGVHLFEISDGEILGTEDYWDAATFRRQMSV